MILGAHAKTFREGERENDHQYYQVSDQKLSNLLSNMGRLDYF